MVRNKLQFLAALTAVFATAMTAETIEPRIASAADITDVLDAADEVYLEDELVSDPFDISLKPIFKQRREWSKIKREFRNGSTYTDGTDNKFGDNQTHLYNELEYERVINEFDIDLEIGLFHDLSFRMTMPIIISDQQSYRFDTSSSTDPITKAGTPYDVNDPSKGVHGSSWFSPATISSSHPYTFFDLNDHETLKGRKRSGFGDMRFGIAWSPYNTERHYIPDRPWKNETGRSTITLGFDYIAPTGKARAIDNSNAGRGIHEMIFSVAASHRFSVLDPYIGLQFGIPVGTDAFKDYGSLQKRKDPGLWGKIDLGMEIVPYESLRKDYQRFVKMNFGFYFKYTGEGRNFSELMDAFGQGHYSSQGVSEADLYAQGYGWLTEKWSNKCGDNCYKEDGIFDYEGYATIGGRFNLTIQPLQYLQILAGVSFDYTADHFITNTSVGRDLTINSTDKNGKPSTDGQVDLTDVGERNPAFSRALDAPGSRIKRTEAMALEWFVGLSLQY